MVHWQAHGQKIIRLLANNPKITNNSPFECNMFQITLQALKYPTITKGLIFLSFATFTPKFSLHFNVNKPYKITVITPLLPVQLGK